MNNQNIAVIEDNQSVVATRQNAASPEQLMTAIITMSNQPTFDADAMVKMTEIYKNMQDREAQKSFASDLAALQGEMPHVEKKRKAQGVSFSFRNVDDIMFHANPLLQKYGFSLKHSQSISNGFTTVTTTLSHRDGHKEETSITLPNDSTNKSKDAIKASLSTYTFGQKRNLESFLNISGVDETSSAPIASSQITAEQAAQVKGIIKQIDDLAQQGYGRVVDMNKLLEVIGASSVDEMLSGKFPQTLRMLKTRLQQAETEAKGDQNAPF